MQTIELECPSCGELLELDRGFAGGVCRCSNCGTLMTVPEDEGAGAEQLSRPARPEDPGAMSSMSGDTMPPAPQERPESPARGTGGSSKRSGSDKRKMSKGKDHRRSTGRPSQSRGRSKSKSRSKKGQSKQQTLMESIEAGEYRTATGKIIKIDTPTRVPTAAKRHTGVRIATGVIFMGIILGIAATAIILVWVFYKPAGDDEIAQQRIEQQKIEDFNAPTFIYSSSANPTEMQYANVLGLPLTPRNVVIVEVSQNSERWVDPLGKVLAASLTRPESSRDVAVFAATANGVKTLGPGMTPASEIKPAQLQSLLSESASDGDGEIAEAIKRALESDPSQIILVVSGPKSADLEKWSDALKDRADLPVSVILVNDFSNALRQWQRDLDAGRYIDVSLIDLNAWAEALP